MHHASFHESDERSTLKQHASGGWLLPVSLMMSAFFVAFVVAGREMTQRIYASKSRIAALESRLAAQDHYVTSMAQQSAERIAETETRALALMRDAVKPIQESQGRFVSVLTDHDHRFETLAGLRRQSEDELAGRLRGEMVGLRDDLANLMHKTVEEQRSDRDLFRAVQQQYDGSILLIHSSFKYRLRAEGTEGAFETGSGWGTGFLVTKEGHILTNKHVVQPWKFDPELAAMEAMGEVEILPDSLRLAAWPAGSQCMSDEREMLYDQGYNNFQLGNLRLLGTAPDSLVTRRFDVAGSRMEYPIHDLDDNDIALLKATGKEFIPLPLPKGRGPVNVRTLDAVMALGFPRGKNGLECGIAATSPSLGTVRKAENTIHVTASIIPGNSGGPLFNRDGEVIGIATRIYSETLGICLRIEHGIALMDRLLAKEAEKVKPTPESAALVAPK